jgi:hypothetical protein
VLYMDSSCCNKVCISSANRQIRIVALRLKL